MVAVFISSDNFKDNVDHPDFQSKETEVANARTVLEKVSYRPRVVRREGVGPQDGIREALDEDTPTQEGNAESN